MDQQIEALLFVSGDEGMSLEQLSQILNCSSSKIKQGLERLENRLLRTCFVLKKKQGQYVLTTKVTFAPLLEKYAKSELNHRLTKPALEVLSVIAYKQPITRLEIDEIRGVQSSLKALQKLLGYQLVEEVGRLDQPGRPKLYGTTDYFLAYFHLESLEDLPPLMEIDDENETQEELFTQLLDFGEE